ncbi:MAG: glycosyltransferase family 2 protein [Candidatus Thermoplasmatota archaeon]
MYKDRQNVYLNHRSSIEGEEEPRRTLAAIPCYNEAKTIGSVVLKAKQYVDEVVVIDDGCTDDTVSVATIAGAKVLRHGGNKGYGAAIQSCFRYARDHGFDVMTILDGDGQHDADQIQTVMTPVVKDKVDISIGSRFLDGTKKNIPLYRRFGIWVLTRLANAGTTEEQHRVLDGQSGFRAYSRKAIELIHPKDRDMGASAEILMQGRKQHLRYTEVPISVDYDLDGSTKRPVGHGLGVIVSILKYMEVEHALLFFGIPGIVLFASGFALGWMVYLDYMNTQVLAVGQALITIGLLVVGMLLGMTGLILHAVINAGQRR